MQSFPSVSHSHESSDPMMASLTSSMVLGEAPTGRVFTAFFCGTCSNSNDYQNYNRYFDGETVSHAYNLVDGKEYIDKIIVDGPGSGENDIHKLWVKYPNPTGIAPRPPGAPADKYTENEGVLLAAGLNERINHVINVIKREPEKAALDANPQIKTILTEIESDPNKEPIQVVNIVGWSRGGAGAITAANRIYHDPALTHIKVNLILLDPVPGFALSDKENRTLPPNVKNVYCVYARDERSAGFSPVIPDVPEGCNFYTTFLPGGHAQVAGDEKDHGGQGIDHVNLRSVGIIGRTIVNQALDHCKTKLKIDSSNKNNPSKLSLKELMVHYDECKRHATQYKLFVMDEPLPSFNAAVKNTTIITEKAIYQFDEEGIQREILKLNDDNKIEPIATLLQYKKADADSVNNGNALCDYTQNTTINKDALQKILMRFDETLTKSTKNPGLHLNYYALIAQRVPYTCSQISGNERKAILGNKNHLNQYLGDIQRERFTKYQPRYIDHMHQKIAASISWADKFVNNYLLDHFTIAKKFKQPLNFPKIQKELIEAIKRLPHKDMLLYRAISERIQSEWRPDHLNDPIYRCYDKSDLTKYLINQLGDKAKEYNQSILPEAPSSQSQHNFKAEMDKLSQTQTRYEENLEKERITLDEQIKREDEIQKTILLQERMLQEAEVRIAKLNEEIAELNKKLSNLENELSEKHQQDINQIKTELQNVNATLVKGIQTKNSELAALTEKINALQQANDKSLSEEQKNEKLTRDTDQLQRQHQESQARVNTQQSIITQLEQDIKKLQEQLQRQQQPIKHPKPIIGMALPKKVPSPESAEDLIRTELIAMLKRYKLKINPTGKAFDLSTAKQAPFRFKFGAKESQANSRIINYKIANDLINELSSNSASRETIERLFDNKNLKQRRISYGAPTWSIHSGIHSNDLNKIIDEAHQYVREQKKLRNKK